MHKKYIIKLFRKRRNSKDKITKQIVVASNFSRVNGGYIERLGIFRNVFVNLNDTSKTKIICSLNLKRIGYWLNRGAILKSKVSWLIGLLAQNDKYNKQ